MGLFIFVLEPGGFWQNVPLRPWLTMLLQLDRSERSLMQQGHLSQRSAATRRTLLTWQISNTRISTVKFLIYLQVSPRVTRLALRWLPSSLPMFSQITSFPWLYPQKLNALSGNAVGLKKLSERHLHLGHSERYAIWVRYLPIRFSPIFINHLEILRRWQGLSEDTDDQMDIDRE